MELTDIATTAAPLDHDSLAGFRLELVLDRTAEDPKLDQLHASERPMFACVYRGQLMIGKSAIRFAVKLQREKRNPEEHKSLADRFKAEHTIHATLNSLPVASLNIVRSFDIRQGDTTDADEIAPSILCANARHAIAPRCHQDTCRDDETAILKHIPLEKLPLGESQLLECPRPGCRKTYDASPENKRRLLLASVRNSKACAECAIYKNQEAPEACLKHAVFLTFYPAKVLLFELLDIDLRDYLSGLDGRPEPHRRQTALLLRRHQEANASGPIPPALNKLMRIVQVFDAVLSAVETLHQKGITHVDLKPDNICLKFDEAGPMQVKVIDLGLALYPGMVAYLQQAVAERKLDTEFAAPEVRHRKLELSEGTVQPLGNGLVLVSVPLPRIMAYDLLDPPVVEGDRVDLDYENAPRVQGIVAKVLPPSAEAEQNQPICNFHLKIESNGAALSDQKPNKVSIRKKPTKVVIHKFLGPAADIYSLGLLLLALISRETELENAQTILSNLAQAVPTLDRRTPVAKLPGRMLIRSLLGLKGAELPYLQAFFTLLGSTQNYQPFGFLVEELFGLAVRCALRGEIGYVADRSKPTTQATPESPSVLSKIQADFQRIKSATETLATLAAAECHLNRQMEQANKWLAAWKRPAVSARALSTMPPVELASVHESLVLGALPTQSASREANWFELQGAQRGPMTAADRLRALLQLWTGTAAPPLQAQTVDRLRGQMLPWAAAFQSQPANIDKFWQRVQTLRRNGTTAPWQPLWETLNQFDTNFKCVERYVQGMESIFLGPLQAWIHEARAGHFVEYELGSAIRSFFDVDQSLTALQNLERLRRRTAGTIITDRIQEWNQLLAAWNRHAPTHDRELLRPFTEELNARMQQIAQEHESWEQDFANHYQNLDRHLRLTGQILDLLDAQSPSRWLWPWSRQDRSRICLRLNGDHLDLRMESKPLAALAFLRENWLGPRSWLAATLAVVQLGTAPE